VHPVPKSGVLAQYIPEPWRSKYFTNHPVGDQIYYDAPDYAHSYAMRVDSFPPDGEFAWQRLQGHVYGNGIVGAAMFEGVDSFLRRCRAEGSTVFIVSHKTEYGHHDAARVNLRKAALDWMTGQGFFHADRYGIPMEHVFFEGTRPEKLARIASLACTHFIDDLEEVLSDTKFPPGVTRILFSETGPADDAAPYLVCPSWRRIEESVFDDRA